jgi:sialidase-1
MSGIVRYSTEKSGGKNRILFSNPHNLERADGKAEAGKNRDRKNVSVKLSYDEGQTWAVDKTVEAGWSAYSDIGVMKSGTILCIYGRAAKPGFAGDALTLARFNIEWLTNGKDASK